MNSSHSLQCPTVRPKTDCRSCPLSAANVISIRVPSAGSSTYVWRIPVLLDAVSLHLPHVLDIHIQSSPGKRLNSFVETVKTVDFVEPKPCFGDESALRRGMLLTAEISCLSQLRTVNIPGKHLFSDIIRAPPRW